MPQLVGKKAVNSSHLETAQDINVKFGMKDRDHHNPHHFVKSEQNRSKGFGSKREKLDLKKC